ncbi:MAG: hypothetical protein ACI9OU_000537 [Candidatus Promineifilaceae bacterium]|jgi:hypothetical protein
MRAWPSFVAQIGLLLPLIGISLQAIGMITCMKKRSRVAFGFWALTGSLSVLVGAENAALSSDEQAFFETHIRPVLAENCYECHSADAVKLKGGLLLDSAWGWQQGGQSGPTLVPGKPEESLLLLAINHDPDVEGMPPKSKLSKAKIAKIEEWIGMGAPDPRPKIARTKAEDEFNLQDRRKWWSWQPVAKTRVPKVANTKWVREPIDAFVLAELEKKHWEPAPETDRRTWIRRAYFDLTGLPPSYKAVETFLADTSRKAHETVVDELLASPRFGEHVARKWMDMVRYGETVAFEADYTIPAVYEYRDYLIRAFNADLPYDQFIRESFAGDMMTSPRLDPETGQNESIKGPGFLYLFDGQHGPPDLHEDEARVIDGMIDVIGKTFMGSTIACARCHDHKFDAITTADYYSLYGVLASSRFDMQNAASPEKLAVSRTMLSSQKAVIRKGLAKRLSADFESLETDLAFLTSVEPQTDQQKAWKQAVDGASKPEHALHPLYLVMHATNDTDVTERLGHLGPAQAETTTSIGGLAVGTFGEWLANGPSFGDDVRPAGDFIVNREGDHAIRTMVGNTAAAGHLTPRSSGSLKSPTFILNDQPIRVRVKGKGSRVNLVIHHYQLVGSGPTTTGLTKSISSDNWHEIRFNTPLWIGLRAHLSVELNRDSNMHKQHHQIVYNQNEDAYIAIADARFGDRVTTQSPWHTPFFAPNALPKTRAAAVTRVIEELRAVADAWGKGTLTAAKGPVLEALFDAKLLDVTLTPDDALTRDVELYRALLREVPKPVYVRTLADGAGTDEPVYIRGQHKNLSTQPNPRHYMDGIDPAPFDTQGSGRGEWAEALVSKDNPLVTRVIVNRLWDHMFGEGLVKSVDDFGHMGRKPSHPALLEYLARDFARNDWSIKSILRKLALSSTYRMSAVPSVASQDLDPENAVLQHMPVRRLAAEAIRDTILALSGDLKLDMYGPSVPVNLHETQASRARPKNSGPLNGGGRRSVYQEVRRNFPQRFLVAFDQPNSSAPRGKRTITNVPAQSLALMNDPFVIEQAGMWARRLIGEHPDQVEDRFRAIITRAFGRNVDDDDKAWFAQLYAQLSEQHGVTDAVSNHAVWQDVCHVMLNRKELIYYF